MRNRQVEGTKLGVVQRHDPAVRAIVLAWRLLTSPSEGRRAGKGAPTLVACSGGADSTALAVALARTGSVTLAHVVHDLRPREQAEADRDAVRRLADRLDLPLLEREVRVRAARESGRAVGAGGETTPETTNLEARARHLRYRALADMARQSGVMFVATAHHADDQLETMLMALLRGTGLRGLRGVHLKRVLRRAGDDDASHRAEPIWLIRPMIHPARPLTKADAEGLCTRAGLAWREDLSNADVSRLRAGIRASVLPLLNQLRPGASARAALAAVQLQGATRVIDREVGAWIDTADRERDERGRVIALTFERDRLSKAGGAGEFMIGQIIRRAYAVLMGSRGLDQLGSRTMQAIVRAVRDGSTDRRSITLSGGRRASSASTASRRGAGGGGGCVVVIHAGRVSLRAVRPGAAE